MKHKEYIDDICKKVEFLDDIYEKVEFLLESISKAEHSGFDFHEYPVGMLREISATRKSLIALRSEFNKWYETFWEWIANAIYSPNIKYCDDTDCNSDISMDSGEAIVKL